MAMFASLVAMVLNSRSACDPSPLLTEGFFIRALFIIRMNIQPTPIGDQIMQDWLAEHHQLCEDIDIPSHLTCLCEHTVRCQRLECLLRSGLLDSDGFLMVARELELAQHLRSKFEHQQLSVV